MWLTTLDYISSAVATKRAGKPNSESRETEPDTPRDEQQTCYSSERDASWHYFFYENEQRKANYPNQVHDASIEQEAHQKPATAQAEYSVLDAHPECAPDAGVPMRRQKANGRPAMAQAYCLKRC